ncbi:MAG: DUF6889 family protein [Rhodomicrobium sp.]
MIDGTLDLENVAVLNDALDAFAENRRRAQLMSPDANG